MIIEVGLDQKFFEEQMQQAEAKILIGDRPEYWRGYQQGLMRQYHGDSFMTLQEHRKWMEKAKAKDRKTFEAGKGYLDGYLV